MVCPWNRPFPFSRLPRSRQYPLPLRQQTKHPYRPGHESRSDNSHAENMTDALQLVSGVFNQSIEVGTKRFEYESSILFDFALRMRCYMRKGVYA
jgi:hypothetical protein